MRKYLHLLQDKIHIKDNVDTEKYVLCCTKYKILWRKCLNSAEKILNMLQKNMKYSAEEILNVVLKNIK